jgi:hypothetical protein
MATAKTWIIIILAIIGAGVLCVLALAGAGFYYLSRHVGSEPATNAAALRAFDTARLPFKDKRPLIELDDLERPRVTVRASDLPTAAAKPSYLYVLAWGPDDQKLVHVSVPFWLLRMGHRKINLLGNRSDMDLADLHLDFQELERIGSALVLDFRAPSGNRVLIYTR